MQKGVRTPPPAKSSSGKINAASKRLELPNGDGSETSTNNNRHTRNMATIGCSGRRPASRRSESPIRRLLVIGSQSQVQRRVGSRQLTSRRTLHTLDSRPIETGHPTIRAPVNLPWLRAVLLGRSRAGHATRPRRAIQHCPGIAHIPRLCPRPVRRRITLPAKSLSAGRSVRDLPILGICRACATSEGPPTRERIRPVSWSSRKARPGGGQRNGYADTECSSGNDRTPSGQHHRSAFVGS